VKREKTKIGLAALFQAPWQDWTFINLISNSKGMFLPAPHQYSERQFYPFLLNDFCFSFFGIFSDTPFGNLYVF